MNNKIYKIIFIIFNILMFIVINFSYYLLQSNSSLLNHDMFYEILFKIIYLIVLIGSVLNIITKKTYKNKNISKILKIFSIIICVFAIVNIFSGIILNEFSYYEFYELLFVISIFSFIFSLKNILIKNNIKNNKIHLIDYMPIIIMLVFTLILGIVYIINCGNLSFSDFTHDHKLFYYMKFLVFPLILTNFYVSINNEKNWFLYYK